MATIFKKDGVNADHASGIVSRLEGMALVSNRTKLGPINDFAHMIPFNSTPLAVMDIPVNTFIWDLLDAFPNGTVSLSLRNVRAETDVLLSPIVSTAC